LHRIGYRDNPQRFPLDSNQSHLTSGDFTVEALSAFLSYEFLLLKNLKKTS